MERKCSFVGILGFWDFGFWILDFGFLDFWILGGTVVRLGGDEDDCG